MGVKGLATDTWVVSEGGCASAASGDLRSGAPHTILSYKCIFQSVLLLLGDWFGFNGKEKT